MCAFELERLMTVLGWKYGSDFSGILYRGLTLSIFCQLENGMHIEISQNSKNTSDNLRD